MVLDILLQLTIVFFWFYFHKTFFTDRNDGCEKNHYSWFDGVEFLHL